MNVAFRTDASTQIGTGHFMRCLTLADGLGTQAGRIRFLSRNLPAHLHEMLASRGFEHVPLNDEGEDASGTLAHSHWLPAGQEADAKTARRALQDDTWDWLVVDHYALDADWERAVRPAVGRVMVIDDLADRQHDCDVLLDQNYYVDMQFRYEGKVPSSCRLLLGPRYALLREEFSELRKHVKPRDGKVRRILVFFGGVDAGNYTGLAIQALLQARLAGVLVDVVIGAQHPCRMEIERACAEAGYACHVQTTRMAELMAQADFAIGASGAASWERCCLGLPSLVAVVADNQIKIADDLEKTGAIAVMRGGQPSSAKCMAESILEVICNSNAIQDMSNQGLQLVDGMGAGRVMRELMTS